MKLCVNQLTIEYPGCLLFKDVSLEAEDHQMIAIETCSQDGGTSLLKAIAGMLDGVQGSVTVGDTDVLGRRDPELMHRIGFVYEAQGLVSLLNIADNITLPLRFFARQFHQSLTPADVDARLLAICQRLQLDPSIMSLHPHRINDVQTRLANLARALIVGPDLLLIDELEGGMAEQQLCETLAAIRLFQQERPMPVLITALSSMVLNKADKIYRIQGRCLVQDSL
jgi:ABC-type sulfate/molybdate transport systems ATPase subunit